MIITRRFTVTAVRSDAYVLYYSGNNFTWVVTKTQISTNPDNFVNGDEVDLTWDDEQVVESFSDASFDEIMKVN